MGRVIRELTHPYSLTHKDYKKKKRMRLFVVCFLERDRGGGEERENFETPLKGLDHQLWLI